MSRLTYHIPNFTYPDTPPERLFERVADQAHEAERAGFDRVTVMDHLFQLPGIGSHDEPMLECYTTLAALSQRTERVQLGALVTGNTYRNPGLLAKEVATLDVVSAGRAALGIGAGWFELEHEAFGFEFQTFTDRFEKLEESLRIVVPLLAGETVTFEGERYQVRDAVLSPPPLSRVPVLIGGSGERKTLRMVAEYADESNLVGLSSPDEVPRKLEALAGHCDRLGRDRSEVTVSITLGVNLAPTTAEADEDLRRFAEAKGLGDDAVEAMRSRMIHGDPDTVAEGLVAYLDQGLDGVAWMALANGHVPRRLELLGEVSRRVLDR